MKSNYDPNHVKGYYDEDPEREWTRLVQSPDEEIKLYIHDHYLRANLTSGMRVLEIGAGPGRFTKTLHEIGCSIVVADISSGQLEANREKSSELGFAASVEQWLILDICAMQDLDTGSFDAVVAYGGPLSYVFEKADDAIEECFRVLKPNGQLLASVMSLWGTLHRHFNSLVKLPKDNNLEVVRTGNLTPETDPGSQHHCHMFRADELKLLVERGGFRVTFMSASNSFSSSHSEQLLSIRDNPDLWRFILELELESCASPGYIEAGTHLLILAAKQ